MNKWKCIIAVIILLLATGCSERIASGTETDTGAPSNTISGIVRDSAGGPAEGAEVFLLTRGHNPYMPKPLDKRAAIVKVMTDSLGRFRFDSVSAGIYNIEAAYAASGTRLLLRDIEAGGGKDIGSLEGVLAPPGSLTIPLAGRPAAPGNYFYLPGTSAFSEVAATHLQKGFITLAPVAAAEYPELYHVKHGDTTAANILIRQIRLQPAANPVLGPFQAWEHSARVFINTTLSGAGVADDVYDFPLLVRLSSPSPIFENAKPGGADLRFAKSDGVTALPFEIASWDPDAELAEAWVQLDTVYGNTASQSFYMYSGNPAAASASDGPAVFDTDRGFAGAWHLDEKPRTGAPVMKDATGNSHHGTPMGGMDAGNSEAGVVGRAVNFDGVDDYIDLGSIAADFSGGVAICAWARYDAFHYWSRILEAGNGSSRDNILLGNRALSDTIAMHTYNQDQHQDTFGPRIRQGEWEYICADFDGAGLISYYLNGAPAGSASGNALLRNVARDSCFIGRSPWSIDGFLDGAVDELRLMDRPVDEHWARLSYENQRPGGAMVRIE